MPSRKLTAVINQKNRYRNVLKYNGEVILTGNNGLERVDVVSGGPGGKRTMLVLHISEFEVILEACPEIHRFDRVLSVMGDAEEVIKLRTSCHLLRASPNACNGCVYRPAGT